MTLEDQVAAILQDISQIKAANLPQMAIDIEAIKAANTLDLTGLATKQDIHNINDALAGIVGADNTVADKVAAILAEFSASLPVPPIPETPAVAVAVPVAPNADDNADTVVGA